MSFVQRCKSILKLLTDAWPIKLLFCILMLLAGCASRNRNHLITYHSTIPLVRIRDVERRVPHYLEYYGYSVIHDRQHSDLHYYDTLWQHHKSIEENVSDARSRILIELGTGHWWYTLYITGEAEYMLAEKNESQVDELKEKFSEYFRTIKDDLKTILKEDEAAFR